MPVKRTVIQPSMKDDEMLNILFQHLKGLNLGEKLNFNDFRKNYPSYIGDIIPVEKLNLQLNPLKKEVTFIEDHYLMVELGEHKKRVEEHLKYLFMTQSKSLSAPGYYDDISPLKGTFHLKRDETGKIESSPFEDDYGEE